MTLNGSRKDCIFSLISCLFSFFPSKSSSCSLESPVSSLTANELFNSLGMIVCCQSLVESNRSIARIRGIPKDHFKKSSKCGMSKYPPSFCTLAPTNDNKSFGAVMSLANARSTDVRINSLGEKLDLPQCDARMFSAIVPMPIDAKITQHHPSRSLRHPRMYVAIPRRDCQCP